MTRVKTNRFFESSPQALPLCYTVMEEVVAVARAKGMTVPDDTVPKLIKQCTDVKTGLPSSMMADNFAGRPMEVEVILGTPVREAARLGVKVPTLLTFVFSCSCLSSRGVPTDAAQAVYHREGSRLQEFEPRAVPSVTKQGIRPFCT